MPDFSDIKNIIAAVGALIAAISGGATLSGKFGWDWFDRPVLEWHPEQFEISDGYIDEGFKVVVARQKLRDDCEVVSFRVELRDSEYLVHPLTPSVAKFSGPANETVDLFGYRIYLPEMHMHKVAMGEATLLGQIKYACPEGEQIVTYPSHPNLTFNILGVSSDETH